MLDLKAVGPRLSMNNKFWVSLIRKIKEEFDTNLNSESIDQSNDVEVYITDEEADARDIDEIDEIPFKIH